MVLQSPLPPSRAVLPLTYKNRPRGGWEWHHFLIWLLLIRFFSVRKTFYMIYIYIMEYIEIPGIIMFQFIWNSARRIIEKLNSYFFSIVLLAEFHINWNIYKYMYISYAHTILKSLWSNSLFDGRTGNALHCYRGFV